MDAILFKLLAVVYLLSAGSFFYSLFRGEIAARLPTALLLLGFVIHTMVLTGRFLQEGFAGVAVMGHAFLFNGWLMVGIYLLIQLRYRLAILGGIIAPLAFLMTFAAFAVGKGAAEIPPALQTYWLPVHVTLAFLGNAVFALAFGVSLISLLPARRLTHKKMTALMTRFPPLESLDRLNYMLLV